LRSSGRTSSPSPTKSWSASLRKSPRRSTSSCRDYLFPAARGRQRSAQVPASAQARAAVAARRALRRLRRLLELSRVQVHPQVRPAGRGGRWRRGRRTGQGSRNGRTITRKVGPVRPLYPAGRPARRPSAPRSPRTLPGELTLDWAVKLLSLPRAWANHPETGKPITASIGRYGPYLRMTASMPSCAHRRSVRNRHERRRHPSWPRRPMAAGRAARATGRTAQDLRSASRHRAARSS
jgi:hypothetical protein